MLLAADATDATDATRPTFPLLASTSLSSLCYWWYLASLPSLWRKHMSHALSHTSASHTPSPHTHLLPTRQWNPCCWFFHIGWRWSTAYITTNYQYVNTHTTHTHTHTHTHRTHAKYVSLQGQNTTDFFLFPSTPANTRAKMCWKRMCVCLCVCVCTSKYTRQAVLKTNNIM